MRPGDRQGWPADDEYAQDDFAPSPPSSSRDGYGRDGRPRQASGDRSREPGGWQDEYAPHPRAPRPPYPNYRASARGDYEGGRRAAANEWDDDALPRRAFQRSSPRAYGASGRSMAARHYGERGAASPRGNTAGKSSKSSSRAALLMILALVLVLVPIGVIFGVLPRLRSLQLEQATALFPWAGSSQQTNVNAANAAFASQQDPVDPGLQASYTAQGGSAALGTALTPGIPTSVGIVQFYTAGALLAVSSAKGQVSSGNGNLALQLVGTGPSLGQSATAATVTPGGASTPPASGTPAVGTPTTGKAISVVPAPLVAALLKAGAKVPVVAGASTKYIDLRTAASPDQLVSGATPSPLPATAKQPVFIATDTQGGSSLGHAIPAALWNYITSSSVSPSGWQTNIGAPLTEALAVTANQSGATHHLLVQAFWNAVVVADADTLNSSQPSITRASIGLDYLWTLGPPTVTISATTHAWAASNTSALDAAATGKEIAHFGANFPMTTTGQSTWSGAALWYGVSWSAGNGKQNGKGWLAGTALTFSAPDPSKPANAAFDVLSPDLAAYTSQQGQNMGVAVYDITRNTYYGYNDGGSFDMASVSKAIIMVSYLDWVEKQNRALRSDEIASLTAMIEVSDNNAAQLLYERQAGALGYGPGLGWGLRQRDYLRGLGLNDYVPCDSGWGCANLSPASMTQVLSLMYQGKILTSDHRQLALNLMNHIDASEDPGNARMGIGTTAPQGATVYLKNGWRPVDEGNNADWTLNTTGIVVDGNEAYVVTVFSNHIEQDNWTAVNKVCGDIGKLLTP